MKQTSFLAQQGLKLELNVTYRLVPSGLVITSYHQNLYITKNKKDGICEV